MDPPPPGISKRRARLHFERAAATYDSAAVLQREICARLLERLELVKLQPRTILDAGSGTGHMARALAARYPRARVVALDFSLAMLRRGRAPRSWWSRLTGRGRPLWSVCGDFERLPLRAACVDLICSNFALEWAARPERALREWLRVLTRGGLLMFSTLGPDTLRELRTAHRGAARVHAFADMHDTGDLLVRAGYADPVMDMERMTLTFSDFAALARELRASGCSNAASAGDAGLRGRGWLRQLEQGYEPQRREGRLPVTFEIVYGHAWKPQQGPRVTEDGRAVIRVQPRALP
jgi:malonyl-CoA O-methyltransferase